LRFADRCDIFLGNDILRMGRRRWLPSGLFLFGGHAPRHNMPGTARRTLWSFQSRWAPLFFLLPFLLLLVTFLLYPMVRSANLSLYKVASPTAMRFIGLDNYRFLLRDRVFLGSVLNTLYFAIAFICLQMPLSLGLALLLNRPALRFRNVYRFAFFSTHLVGAVFVGVIFALLLTPRHGPVDRAIGAIFPRLGVETPWLSSPILAMPAILMAALWISVGYGMIYFLAALQAVDPQLYDAAVVDGAGRFGTFWHVTLPSIAPMLRFLALVGLIWAVQLFELPWVLFQQTTGPAGRGLTMVMYLYIMGIGVGDLGYASAVGWVLVLIILLVSLIGLPLLRSREAR
jgi:ABC-type sugar transport system permease subunit